jgi:hypothetical protein
MMDMIILIRSPVDLLTDCQSGVTMTREIPESDQALSSSGGGITRRDMVSVAIAAVGLTAASKVTAADGATNHSPAEAIPMSGRGYFPSNGGMFIPRAQGFDATNAEFYEAPLEDPNYLEVWTYTDKISYLPGEEVLFHTSTTGKSFSIEIISAGPNPKPTHVAQELPGKMYKLPPDFFEKGCGWPVSYRWRIPEDLPSGFYMVISRTSSSGASDSQHSLDGQLKAETREQEHGFFVRAPKGKPRADILLVASTSTWTAYNDWGGFSHYVGYHLKDKFTFAPRLTLQRPFARGIIRSPEGAPRKPHDFKLPPNAIPRYPVIEFAYTRGYSKWFTNCGWATYERHFAEFAEREHLELDYATQIDLHYEPHLLDDYKCVVIVGHCEYWSWEMREAVDRYVEGGGNVARFAGNCAWQIRLEDEGRTQVAYKDRALDSDPVRNTSMKRRITGLWNSPEVNWFSEETFGLSALYGVYAHVGVNVPRGTGGFTVYRPKHWAFKDTDLYYGDDFGGDARIFGYEVDGLDYTFRDGLPFPTEKNRAPLGTEILAMALASNQEPDRGHNGTILYYGDGSAGIARARYRAVDEETKQAGARGNGMIIAFNRGKGMVFHAGTCEWVAGLKARDYCTETITRNVLRRFTGKA